MSSKRPWMPLYIEDYLAATGHLEVHEHGAYLLLIMHYWSKGELPKDERLIRRISKLSLKQWLESKATLQSYFYDGWKHKRIDDEIEHAIEISRVKSANAKRQPSDSTATAKRQRSERTADAPTDVGASADTLHTSHSTLHKGGEKEPPAPDLKLVRVQTPVPPDFQPDDKAVERCHNEGATDSEIDDEVRKFRNWHRSKGTTFADWQAEFQKWWDKWKPHKDAKAPPRVELTMQPMPATQRRSYQPTEVEWERAAAGFKRNNSHWPYYCGPEPGMSGCRCPAEILRKHGIDPETGLPIKVSAT